MDLLVYQLFAPRYSALPHPIIVADAELIPCYFNLAATACSALEMHPDMLRNTLSPQNMQKVIRCRREGKAQRFQQQFGSRYRKTYLVLVQQEEQAHLSFHFYKQLSALPTPSIPDPEQQQQILNTCLHQLLAASDLMRTKAVGDLSGMGELCRKQIYRAIRLSRQNEALSGEISCTVTHATTLLRTIAEQAAPFLKERFNTRLDYDIPEGNSSIKCSPTLLRQILFSMMAAGMKHAGGDIYLKVMETESQLTLTLHHTGGKNSEILQKAPGAPVSPAALNLSSAYELCRRQQIGVRISAPVSGQLLYCLSFPIALVNGSLKERVPFCLDEDLSTLETEFSEL